MPDDFEEIPYQLDLGPCCVCEGTVGVVSVLMLDALCPMPGKGWGCVQCDLPSNGAMAVVCGECYERLPGDVRPHLRFACKGYPSSDGRVPIGELTGHHEHDLSRHPEAHFGEDL